MKNYESDSDDDDYFFKEFTEEETRLGENLKRALSDNPFFGHLTEEELLNYPGN